MKASTARRRRTARSPRRRAVVLTAILVLIGAGILTLATSGLAVAAAYSYYTRDLPSPDRLENREVFGSTRILDRNGKLLYELFDPQAGKRTTVKLPEVSPFLVKATIAIEDSSFYDNPGISPRGILRAALSYIRGDEQLQGGSSITQQLIKNVLLTPEVSIDRKVQEMILAYRVNQQYSKDQILEWYLNENNYGNMSYGPEAAAESYFGKSAKDLDLAEAAMLAGLPQAPSLLSPLVDPAAGARRQRMVLDAMVRNGDITEVQADAAAREKLQYQPMRYGIEAPHFVMYVRSLLERRYGPKILYSGLTVTTTIDLDMQHAAERIARRQVESLAKYNIHNAALVALRPDTGEILTMLGSVDYFNRDISGQVNIATAERQPGSTFKPITYSAAFTKGWGPATVILDDYTVFKDRAGQPYTPKNVDNKWHGPVSVRTALSNSMNIPAVKTLQFVGVKNAISLAHQMGITSLDENGPYDLSLTLGGGEVKPLDLTYAYSLFANGGEMHGESVPQDQQRPGYRTLEPVAILRVEDVSGRILEEFPGPQKVQVLKPEISYLITSILSDNNARAPLFGYNSPLKLSRPAAVKTGTTENNRDLWTIGYTPELVVGVWVGNSDNEEIAPVLSTLTAAPIWHDFMEEAIAGTRARDFQQPQGLEKVEVCAISGLRPNKYCPDKVTELFTKGTAPTKESDIHRLVVVDKTTGNLATDSTPPDDREEKVIEVYPTEWASWAKEAGKADQPALPHVTPTPFSRPVESRDAQGTLVLSAPATGISVRDIVEIRGTASGKGSASYRVEYGEGLAPTNWRPIGGTHTATVQEDVLERWDTRTLNGVYRLRITLTLPPPPTATPTPAAAPTRAPTLAGIPLATSVPRAPQPPSGSQTRVVEVPVIVDSQPPTVEITFPQDNATIKASQMERLPISAQSSDNYRVAKTDFYVDDQLVGSSTASPAAIEWPTASGVHVIRAVVRDEAGNETRSTDVKVKVQ